MKQPIITFVILSLICSFSIQATQIKFLDFNFDPLVSVPSPDETPLENQQGEGLMMVQFNGQVKQVWLDQLKNSNIKLLQYYPDNTYLVWGKTNQLSVFENMDFVRWSGGFAQAYKKSANLKGRNGLLSNVDVHFYNSGSPEEIVETFKSLGAEVLNYFPSQPDKKLYDAIIRIDDKDVSKLTAVAEVVWVGFIGAEPIFDDESSSQVVAANFDGSNQPLLGYDNWLTTIGLDGSGVIWSITDSGVDYTHSDLNARIVGGHNYPGCVFPDPGDDPATGGHGTHVAGIAGADASAGFIDGEGYLYGLGVAPAFSIFAQNPICGTQDSWPPAGGWQELSKQGVIGGAVGSNNSWTSGEGTAHGYQATERTIDFTVRDGNFDTAGIAEEYMWVFSAGNSGPGVSTLTAPKEAKNVIVTAGTQTWRVSGNVDAMYNSSSRGPAVDGRFVPTIAAPGENVGSTRNDDGGSCGTAIGGTNNLYSFCTGTSMAAPHASGSLALITQWWRQNNAGANPSAAMGKALLINTAQDITGAAPIPNFDEGWGRINLQNLFEADTPFEFFDQETVLDNTNETWEITVGVVDVSKPLKVTLVWSDAPGAIGANPALVNNLDLEVVNGSDTYLGNSFNAGSSITGGTADVLNNMENVFVNAPGGSATITVKATNIAGDGVPLIGDDTDQDFALICSNCALQADFTLDAQPSSISVCALDDAVYNIDIGSILSFSDPVTLSTIGLPTNAIDSYDTNPVTPGNTATLTVSNTENVAVGSYNFDVEATSTTGVKTRTLGLDVFDTIPNTAGLIAPADVSTNIPQQPDFSWMDDPSVSGFLIEVATDDQFTDIVIAETVDVNSFSASNDLQTSTEHFWRVTALSPCGDIVSSVFSFTTTVAPGDCPIGQAQTDIFNYTFDSQDIIFGHGFEDTPANTGGPDAQGWTVDVATGDENWSLQPVGEGGSTAFQADDLTVVNDTSVVSPVMALPTGQGPLTLRFWNTQTIEENAGAGECYDSATLEVSVDGGAFVQVTNADIINDQYTRTTNGGFDHPLPAGTDAWCGDPLAATVYNVNADNNAGSDVQYRFRMTSDSSVGRAEGWAIDNVRITGCEAP